MHFVLQDRIKCTRRRQDRGAGRGRLRGRGNGTRALLWSALVGLVIELYVATTNDVHVLPDGLRDVLQSYDVLPGDV